MSNSESDIYQMTVGDYFKDGGECDDCIFDKEGLCSLYGRGGPDSFCVELPDDELVGDLIGVARVHEYERSKHIEREERDAKHKALTGKVKGARAKAARSFYKMNTEPEQRAVKQAEAEWEEAYQEQRGARIAMAISGFFSTNKNSDLPKFEQKISAKLVQAQKDIAQSKARLSAKKKELKKAARKHADKDPHVIKAQSALEDFRTKNKEHGYA